MNRREALSMVSMIMGGTIVGAAGLLSGCAPEERKASPLGLLNKHELKVLEELAETILPHTKQSPGAKDAGVAAYINSIVSDCYSKQEQDAFIDGIKKLNAKCDESFGDAFIDLKTQDKQSLLKTLEEESNTYNKALAPGQSPHYYTMMKQLTLWGYLTSEVVGTKVMRLVPVPGRYEGCLPYQEGEKMYI